MFEVSKEEYKKSIENYFSGFDKIEFIELNKNKVDEVKYFIFKDNKTRFALVGGIKKDVLKFPFSATFSCFSEIAPNSKILCYHNAIKSLVEEVKKDGKINKIIFCTPPTIYNESHITKLHNALICNGFSLLDYDVNFHLVLKQDYNEIINTDTRRNLKIAEKNNLIFTKTDDLTSVYRIIKQNREEKGYPLWMSEEDILNTSKIIKSDYFLVSHEDKYIAAAYIQHITKNVNNVVYWGNIQEYDRLQSMNFLAKNVYEYYSKQKNLEYLSIGTSTLDSEPNFGLCDFKESIGCICSPKLNFLLNIINK